MIPVAEQDESRPTKPNLWIQLKSVEYIALVVWFSICLIPLQYYVGAIGFQLEQRGDADGKYTRMFSILYASVAGISPFVGTFTDAVGLGATHAVGTIFTAGSLFILASSEVGLPVHAIGMALYSVGRMVVFSAFFTNIGLRFGYSNYGTLSGLGLLISGLISLLQYPLITLASDGYDAEVNIGCGIAMVCMLPYCVWLGFYERRDTPINEMQFG